MIIDEYESGEKFLEKNESYDLVLLDVEMKGRDGFETAEVYRGDHENCLIVIVTSHCEYWKNGYRVNAFRYIEKQSVREELAEMLTACQKILCKKKKIKIRCPRNPGLEIRVDNIIYLESNRPYTTLYLKQGIVDSYEYMSDILKEVEDNGFVQCHKSYVVNLDEIKQVDENMIYLKNGERVKISVRKKKQFLSAYMNYKFNIANQ